MTEVHQDIDLVEEARCKVTGAITGISAYDDKKACILQRPGNPGRLTFESFRELECHT